MAFSQSLIDQARAFATRYVGDLAGTAAAMNDPMAALERLGNASSKAWGTRAMLLDLKQRGLLMASDVKTFDVMRSNLYAAEMGMYTGIVEGLARAGVPRSTLAEFPRPTRIPALDAVPPTTLRPGSVALQGVARRRGLRGPEAAAAAAPAVAAAATPTIVIWAFIIIALLVALALVGAVIAIAVAAEKIGAVFVVEAQTEQLRVFYEARLAFYRGCVAAGTQSPQECAALAIGAVPTPLAALPKQPEGIPGWVWLAAGAGALAIVGTVTYLFRGSGGNRMYRLR